VIEDDVIVLVTKRRETQQAGIVAERNRDLRLAHGLRRLSGHARDQHRPLFRAPVTDGPLRKAKYRLEQADGRIANGELRRVHADGDTAGAGVAVVTRERHLAALIERPVLGQCERMRGNHQAAEELTPQRRDVNTGHWSLRNVLVCRAMTLQPEPSAPPTAAEPPGALPARRAARGSGSSR